MSNAYFKVQEPKNESYSSFAPGTPERDKLKAKLAELRSQEIEIPAIIGGKEVKTDRTYDVVMPHNHKHKLATAYFCGEKEVNMAIEAALEARKKWADMPWEERVAIFQKSCRLVDHYRVALHHERSDHAGAV